MTQINFEYRAGILEGAAPSLDVEWCWFKGDAHVTTTRQGSPAPSLDVPMGATVAEVKAIIRRSTR